MNEMNKKNTNDDDDDDEKKREKNWCAHFNTHIIQFTCLQCTIVHAQFTLKSSLVYTVRKQGVLFSSFACSTNLIICIFIQTHTHGERERYMYMRTQVAASSKSTLWIKYILASSR